MVDTALNEAEEAWARGDVAAAAGIAAASLRVGTPGLDWVRFALRCRDGGSEDLASAILREVVRVTPDVVAAHYELAFLHRLQGQHREAAGLLRAALGRAPDDLRVQLFYAHMLHALGAHPEANQILDRTGVSTQNTAELEAMFAFGRFLAQHPLGRSLIMLDRVKDRHGWIETDDLADRIAAALNEGRPFAMVRLGDGEGGMLTLGQEDEFIHRPLYERNRKELIAMWFGDAFRDQDDGFIRLARNLIESLAECDVLGIPYESWLRHEYAISSLRGISSLVNVYRALLAQPVPAGQFVCSQRAHVDLHVAGHLTRIIADAKRVSVITCLPEVEDLLRGRLGLEEVTVYRIPGERGSQHLLGLPATQGNHYPAEFERLQAELARPHAGRLFLVAGGLLGKLYAATIRRRGGIALDIGSLVDGWTGRMTRPGYDEGLML